MDYDELLAYLSNADNIRVKNKLTREFLAITLVPTFDLYHTDTRSLVGNSKQYKYLLNEFVWYLNGNRSIEYIAKSSKFWKHIADDDGLANSNYGYLTLFEPSHKVGNRFISPAQWCEYILKKDITTRQAMMLYNKPMYVTDTKDFICTQTQQFIFRDRLHSIVNIRSSDAIRGLSFDIPWWRFMTQVMANSLKVSAGDMVVHIGSSHIYEEHFDIVDNMIEDEWTRYRIHTNITLADIYRMAGKWTTDKVASAITLEELDNGDLR